MSLVKRREGQPTDPRAVTGVFKRCSQFETPAHKPGSDPQATSASTQSRSCSVNSRHRSDISVLQEMDSNVGDFLSDWHVVCFRRTRLAEGEAHSGEPRDKPRAPRGRGGRRDAIDAPFGRMGTPTERREERRRRPRWQLVAARWLGLARFVALPPDTYCA